MFIFLGVKYSVLNYIDVIILCPLLWGIYKGFQKGFVLQIISLMALFLGVLGAIKLSSYLIQPISTFVSYPIHVIKLLAFGLTFVVIIILIHFLGKLIEKLIKLVAMELPNKLAGAFFGALKFALITGTLVYYIDVLNHDFEFIPSHLIGESLLYPLTLETIHVLLPSLQGYFQNP